MSKRIFKLTIAGAILATGLSAFADAAVFVRIGPPRPPVERVVRAPGRGYVWVTGYYRWTGRAYVWTPGRWVLPPRPGAVWVAPRWNYVPARRSYVFVEGFWR